MVAVFSFEATPYIHQELFKLLPVDRREARHIGLGLDGNPNGFRLLRDDNRRLPLVL